MLRTRIVELDIVVSPNPVAVDGDVEISQENRRAIKPDRFVGSNVSDPPLFQTCRESREVALRIYKKTVMAPQFAKHAIYFEPEVDTLFIGGSGSILAVIRLKNLQRRAKYLRPELPKPVPRHLLPRLRSIALDASTLFGTTSMQARALDAMKVETLEEIIIIVRRENSVVDNSAIIQLQEFHLTPVDTVINEIVGNFCDALWSRLPHTPGRTDIPRVRIMYIPRK